MKPWPPPVGDSPPIADLRRGAARAAASSPQTASDRWARALDRIAALRAQLIRISGTGSYSQAQYTNAQAFVVLSHAVIEEYIERMVLEVVDASIIAFKNHGIQSSCLLALLTYTRNEPAPEELIPGPWSLHARIRGARQVLWRDIEVNHGLQESNVVPLYLRAGLKESDMARAWLDDMNELGRLRGRIAHTTNGPGATAPDDPGDVLERVKSVLPALSWLDHRMVMLKP